MRGSRSHPEAARSPLAPTLTQPAMGHAPSAGHRAWEAHGPGRGGVGRDGARYGLSQSDCVVLVTGHGRGTQERRECIEGECARPDLWGVGRDVCAHEAPGAQGKRCPLETHSAHGNRDDRVALSGGRAAAERGQGPGHRVTGRRACPGGSWRHPGSLRAARRVARGSQRGQSAVLGGVRVTLHRACRW